jgi:hypothetical protein
MHCSIQILTLMCMLPGMLTGLGPGRVLCIGPNGHVAVEAAMQCSQLACEPTGIGAASHSYQEPAFGCEVCCGDCTDIPSICSLVSAGSRHDMAVDALAQLALLTPTVTLAPVEIQTAALLPADTAKREMAALRTLVLLI